MTLDEFRQQVLEGTLPVVVDVWAPWCGPCRAMEPAFRLVSQQFAGKVQVVKVNADQSAELVRSLGVMGIPTVIAFAAGSEILRRTGLQSEEALKLIFEAALTQRRPAVIPPAPIDRVIRSVAGVALLAMGMINGPTAWLLAAGAVLLFSAFYDRCPIYLSLATRVSAFFNRRK